MKYKVGDRVRIKNFDWFRNEGSNMVVAYMTKYYGEVVTIKSVHKGFYRIKEDGGQYCWIDEMFECKMEEETKPELKFKVGDRVITNKGYIGKFEGWISDYQVRVLFEESGCNVVIHPKDLKLMEEETKPKYEDEVNGEYYSTPKYLVRPSGYQFVDENGNVINAQKIVLEKLVVPKFKKGDKIKDKNNRVWYVEQVGKKHFDISRIPNGGSGYFVPIEDQDYYELVPDIELPKTFEECVSVLMREGGNRMSLEQMNTFRKLIDARNAYWTIAGEEMGLGKPWEPTMETVYCISRNENVMKCSYRGGKSNVLEFPTEEMRDTFYENFKTEIESCKEFL